MTRVVSRENDRLTPRCDPGEQSASPTFNNPQQPRCGLRQNFILSTELALGKPMLKPA
jgi:hypothetical protein